MPPFWQKSPEPDPRRPTHPARCLAWHLRRDMPVGKEPGMDGLAFTLAETTLTALPSGALWLGSYRVLCVSDLHLGKSDRIARRSGIMLPPYETRATLERLATDIAATDPQTVICLGDSFDDLTAANSLDDAARLSLMQLQAGRRWVWIEGNHDPGPVDLGGSHLHDMHCGPLVFRHVAQASAQTSAQAERQGTARAEVSGHYHPKIALPGGGGARPCFVFDDARVILPAYGAYTGGLCATSQPLRGLLAATAYAVLTGRRAIIAPLPLSRPMGRSAPLRSGWRGRSG